MKQNEVVLTICIPTYNRQSFLNKQLIFFKKQIELNLNILQRVKFIISDNASTDNTRSLLLSWDKNSVFFKYYSNEVNCGLAGNIAALLKHSTTGYVWFVSDDDELKDGIIEKVLDILDKFNPEFLFINYSSASNINKPGYSGAPGYHKDAKGVALKIFNEAYGSLVFMTSCVYKRENILELNNDLMSSWISVPLFYSFYSCSKGPIYIIGDPMVIFNSGNASYAGIIKVLKIKFEEYVKILERLVEFGYNRNEAYQVTKTFFKKQSHSHFLYNFVNFSKSAKYYKYYDLMTLLYLPINAFKYLFARNS